MVVLTGPAASGKNSVALAVAERVPPLAVVDIDAVRWMVVKPHVAPWEGEEGRRQHELGVRNGCALARQFVGAGFPALVLDVLTEEVAAVYRELLHDIGLTIIQLLPAWHVVEARFIDRSRTLPSATLDEARLVYQWQTKLQDVDQRIDNTSLSVEEVAALITPMIASPG